MTIRATHQRKFVVLRKLSRLSVAHAASVRQPPLQSAGRTQGCVRYVIGLRAMPALGEYPRADAARLADVHRSYRLFPANGLLPKRSTPGAVERSGFLADGRPCSTEVWGLGTGGVLSDRRFSLKSPGAHQAGRSTLRISVRDPSRGVSGSSSKDRSTRNRRWHVSFFNLDWTARVPLASPVRCGKGVLTDSHWASRWHQSVQVCRGPRLRLNC